MSYKKMMYLLDLAEKQDTKIETVKQFAKFSKEN